LIDEEVADEWGRMMGLADVTGRPLPIIDSLLAATALSHNLTFVTRDIGAFALTGVQLFNPWQV
jgi:predicted nucleic acid-binding protein